MRSGGINPDEVVGAVAPAPRLRGTPVNLPASATAGPSFHDVLRGNQAAPASSPVIFSAHAQDRLRSRGITLSPNDLARISDMVDRVAQKGGKQSMFLVNTTQGQQAAMVVSIKNRVVITAVDGASLRDNLFTNIDSAAIV